MNKEKEIQKKRYDQAQGPRSKREFDITSHKVRRLLKGKILDAGGGTGQITYGLDSTVLDISKKSLEKARAHGLKTVVGDIENMPFESNTFDTVLLCHVLEHVLEPEKTLKECKRVLKKNGRVVIVVPNARAIHQLWLLLKGRVKPAGNPPGEFHHYTQFTDKTLRKTVSKYFKVTRVEGDVLTFPGMHALKLYRLGSILASSKWANNIILVGQVK